MGSVAAFQEDKHYVIPFIQVARIVKFLEKGAVRSYCLVGTVSVWKNEQVLQMDGGDGCTTM